MPSPSHSFPGNVPCHTQSPAVIKKYNFCSVSVNAGSKKELFDMLQSKKENCPTQFFRQAYPSANKGCRSPSKPRYSPFLKLVKLTNLFYLNIDFPSHGVIFWCFSVNTTLKTDLLFYSSMSFVSGHLKFDSALICFSEATHASTAIQ